MNERHTGSSNKRNFWVSIHRERVRCRAMFGMLAALLCVFLNTASGQYTAIKVPKGYVQLQGDVITTESNAAVLLGQVQGPHPDFTWKPALLWPNRVVPYAFDSSVNSTQQLVFQAAMAAWSNSFPGVTTISFKPYGGEAGYVNFVVADPGFTGGTADYIGYKGSVVTITVHSNAVNTGTIQHELGHALGLWHEQSRSDRDNYVSVITNSIQDGKLPQFEIKASQATFGDYDYASLMHYRPCSFSVCDGTNGNASCACTKPACATLQVVSPYDSNWQCKIGNTASLSAMEKRCMAFMYGPPEWKFLHDRGVFGGFGSFQQPYRTVAEAVAGIPANSTLWIGSPYTFSAAGMTISKPMTLRAAIPDLQMQADGSLGPSSSGYVRLQ